MPNISAKNTRRQTGPPLTNPAAGMLLLEGVL